MPCKDRLGVGTVPFCLLTLSPPPFLRHTDLPNEGERFFFDDIFQFSAYAAGPGESLDPDASLCFLEIKTLSACMHACVGRVVSRVAIRCGTDKDTEKTLSRVVLGITVLGADFEREYCTSLNKSLPEDRNANGRERCTHRCRRHTV